MRRTRFLCQTLRDAPAETEQEGHALLLRGGFIAPLAAGVYQYLPLGQRVRRHVEGILREEMAALGGQEVALPLVQPADLWRESGRLQRVGPELARFADRAGRDFVLAMTHEEAVTDLLRRQIRSYRQLPALLYQISTKFRDEARPRGGLMRTREFPMMDAYSAHATEADLAAFYRRMFVACLAIGRRVGLDVIGVRADAGAMGGASNHEVVWPHPDGEETLARCSVCGYAATTEAATFGKPTPDPEPLASLAEVATPETRTIAALTRLLNIPASRTAKAAFFAADRRLIFAVVRGDMEVNERKLAQAVGAGEVRAANAEELAAAGIVAGYASPIGVQGVTVVVDDLVARSPNLVAGANRVGYHLRNTNHPRDYAADVVADITAVYNGAPCPRCAAPLATTRAVEVGHLFALGSRYSAPMGATFLDDQGRAQPIVMASYGIGVGRLIACIAEAHHDDRGLVWPVSVAPFQAYLVGLDLERDDVREASEALYERLVAAGVDTLYDDRPERAGVKFNDADLLGMPVRLTLGKRSFERGVVEIVVRATGEKREALLRDAAAATQVILAQLATELQANGGSAQFGVGADPFEG